MTQKLLQEDGFGLLLEDGSGYILEEEIAGSSSLRVDGSHILRVDGTSYPLRTDGIPRDARFDYVEPALTAAAVPIAGGTIAAVLAVTEPVLTAGAVPIAGGAITPAIARLEPALTAAAVPIAGGTITPAIAVTEPALTAGAVPIVGGTIAGVHAVTEPALTAGTVPIAGGAIAGVRDIPEPALTAAAVPIAGGTITPAIARLEPALTAGTVPIASGTITPAIGRLEPVLAAGAVPIVGGTITPVLSTSGAALDLDFRLSDTLDARITFTRGSSATYYNSSGVLTSAVTNVPRRDFDPTTLVCRGLLLEGQRTNLAIQSGDIGNAAWAGFVDGTGSSSRVSNSGVAPDGNNTATLVTINRSDPTHWAQGNAGNFTSAGGSYTASLWIKAYQPADVGKAIDIALYDGSTAYITTITLTADWVRYTRSAGLAGAAAQFLVGYFSGSFAGFATATTAIGQARYLAWGGQVEAGDSATSYIPTTTVAVTRSADTVVMTGTNFSSWFNASAGTFVASFDVNTAGTLAIIGVDDNTTNESITLGVTSSLDPIAIVRDGGVVQASLVAGTVTTSIQQKLALAYAVNDFASAFNGGAVANDAAGTLPTVDRLRIGSDVSGNYLTGHIARLTFYAARKSDAELPPLTAVAGTISETLTPGAVPVTGGSITPVFSAGSVAYSDTLAAASIPIVGSTIAPLLARVGNRTLRVDGSFILRTDNSKQLRFTYDAPVLTWVSASSDATPDFDIDWTIPFVAGDIITVEYQIAPGFSSPTRLTYTLTSADITAGNATLGLPSLVNGSYDVRVKVTRSAAGPALLDEGGLPVLDEGGLSILELGAGTDSFWSNTSSITIVAAGIAYSDTIVAASIPIAGGTVSPAIARLEPALSAGVVPIAGGTVTPAFARREPVLAAGAIPIAGGNITPVFSAGGINYSDTIVAASIPIAGGTVSDKTTVTEPALTAGSIPIAGGTITGVRAIPEPVLTAGSVPIVGGTVTAVLARTEAVTASAVPIAGGTISDQAAYRETLVAGAVPIAGGSITPAIARLEPALTAGAIPIVGGTITPAIARLEPALIAGAIPIASGNITPIFSAGEINYSDLLVAASLPIAGGTITDKTGRLEPVLTAGSVPIVGLALSPIHGRIDALTAARVPITGQTIAALGTRHPTTRRTRSRQRLLDATRPPAVSSPGRQTFTRRRAVEG